MNFAVNKIMNENYLESYLTSIMAPNDNAYVGFQVYTELNSDQTINSNGEYPFLLFTPAGFLNVIDKLNLEKFNGTLSLGSGVSFTILMNTLYSKNSAQRNSALDYLVTQTVLTEAEVISAKALTSDFLNFDIAKLNMGYVDITIPGNEALTDVIEYSYADPIELNNNYDNSNNAGGDKIYLTIFPLINKNYGNTDGTIGDYVSTHTYQNDLITVEQSSYLAVEMGDINDADADVKYDHVDKIDFIDSFRLRFRLPKILS